MRQNTAGTIDRPLTAAKQAGTGLFIGKLLSLAEDGMAVIGLPAADGVMVVTARASASIRSEHVGAQVVVLVEPGAADRSVVIGVVQNGAPRPSTTRPVEVSMDVASLEIAARDRIVLRCGKASITLTRDGKVLVRGTKVLNRASGVNRILGGSVQIN